MIDLHCHLDLYENPKIVIDECVRRQLYVLSITTTPSAWKKTNDLVTHHNRIKTALGLHPLLAKERIHELNLFDELFSETRYIGEIGLDGSKENLGFWDDQMQVFNHILNKCNNAQEEKILSIHSRNAIEAVLSSLDKYPNAGKVILHWYSGGITHLKEAISRGYWFSINPVMLKGDKGKKLVSLMPRSRILLESDGPFTSMNNTHLYPWDVDLVISQISIIWNCSTADVNSQILNNFTELLKTA